jgi:hypothetical protein
MVTQHEVVAIQAQLRTVRIDADLAPRWSGSTSARAARTSTSREPAL